MSKLLVRLSVLIIPFLVLWLGLSQFNLRKTFKVEETKESTEEKLSKLLMDIYTSRDEPADDDSKAIVNQIKNKICRANDIDSSRFKVHVLMKDEINAFALPDGQIVFYSGLIKECQNGEELAAVVAHEMAHITQNHIMKKLAREFGASVLIGLSGGADFGTITQIANMIASSGYSRKLESEADEYSVKYMLEAEIDPEPMADFMFRLATMGEDVPEFMNWVSTHPGSENRAMSILEQIEEEEYTTKPILTEEEWEILQSIHEKGTEDEENS